MIDETEQAECDACGHIRAVHNGPEGGCTACVAENESCAGFEEIDPAE